MGSHLGDGTELAGYRIESVLGRGGMSVVYLAEHLALRRKVALKVIAPELAQDPRFRDRFVKESQVAAALEDPNVIPIYEAGEADGVLFIAMRYVPGTDLKRLIEAEGPLEPGRVVGIVSQIARALDAAHRAGLVHRDVKPANILLIPPVEPGAVEHVYLSDFGLTKRAESRSGITGTGQFIGTIDYMAPEQIEGKALDGRADVYSLGCVLFECLTGEPPFRKDSDVALLWAHVQEPPPVATARRPELARELDAVIARAMAKAPDHRYRSAGELAAAARGAIAPASSAAPPEPPAERRRRVPSLLAGTAAVVVLAAILTVFLVNRGGGTTHPRASHPASSTAGTAGAPPLPANSVAEIDPGQGKVLTTVTGIATPLRVVVGEGGVWVLSGFANLVHVDPASHATTAIPIRGLLAGGVAVGNGAIWVASGNISRVDPATDEVVAIVTTQKAVPALAPSGVAVAASGVWVSSSDGTLLRIDAGTNRVAAVIHMGSDAEDVAVGASSVWVADALDSIVDRVDPSTGKVAARIPVGGADQVAVGSGAVWALDRATGTVARIDPATDRVVTTIRVGNDPTRITAGLGAVWVSDGDGSLYRIAPVTNSVTSISVGAPLSSVAIDTRDATLWVAVGTSG